MTEAQLLQSVYNHLGSRDESTWPAPFVLAKAKDAIKLLVKELVYSSNPLSRVFVAKRTFAAPSVGDFGFYVISLNSSSLALDAGESDFIGYVINNRKFVTVSFIDGSANKTTMEPAFSWLALDTMPVRHCKSYYKVEGNTLYMKFHTGAVFSGGIQIENYEYPTITNYPFELIDLLLGKLVPMLVQQSGGQNDTQRQVA